MVTDEQIKEFRLGRRFRSFHTSQDWVICGRDDNKGIIMALCDSKGSEPYPFDMSHFHRFFEFLPDLPGFEKTINACECGQKGVEWAKHSTYCPLGDNK